MHRLWSEYECLYRNVGLCLRIQPTVLRRRRSGAWTQYVFFFVRCSWLLLPEYILALYLARILSFCHTFWGKYFGILSGINSGVLSGMRSYLAFSSSVFCGVHSGIQLACIPAFYSGILFWHFLLAFYVACILAFDRRIFWHSILAFSSGILSGVLAGIYSDILLGMLSGIQLF